MTDTLKDKLSINIYELNAILTFVGFPIFTQLVYGQSDSDVELGSSGSSLSILYRACCLFLALVIIFFNRGYDIKYPKTLIWTLVLYILMSIKVIYAFFLAPYSDLWDPSVITTKLTFLFGVVLIPLLAMAKSFQNINWEKVLNWIIICLAYLIINTLLTSSNVEGRVDLNTHQSTLTFGAYSGYLLIIAFYYIKDSSNYLYKLLFCGIAFISLLGLLKAGSRGPLLSTAISIIPFLLFRGKNSIIFLVLILFLGPFAITAMENFAPVIFERIQDAFEIDESTSDRLIAFDIAITKMNEYPLLGESPLFYTQWGHGFGPHNLPLQVGMGLGYLGFILVCVLYYRYLVKAIYSIRESKISGIFGSLLIYFLIRSQTGVDIYAASDFGFVILGVYLYNYVDDEYDLEIQ